jgi:prevent-host-death family protein
MTRMNATHVRPVRDLRNNYSQLAKIVKNQGDHIILTNRGRGETVLIDFEEYAFYQQYLHQKYIDEKLAQAIEQAKNPDAKWIDGDQVMKQARQQLSQIVEKVNQAAKGKGVDLDVYALGEAEARKDLSQADILLLGPQVRYLEKPFRKAIGESDVKLGVVDMMAYGRMDGEKVYEQIMALSTAD